MKTLKFLFCLMAFATLGIVQSAAERVKPELPAPATLEEGVLYYLYNESTGLFMSKSNDDYSQFWYTKASTIPSVSGAYNFVLNEDSTYSIQYTMGDTLKYWVSVIGGEEDGHINCTPTQSERTKFRIKQVENNLYTIQRDYEYDASQYIGYAESDEFFRHDVTTNNRWRLMRSGDVAFWRLYLYNVLEERYGDSPLVALYDSLLVNSTDVNQLYKASMDLTYWKRNYVAPEWADCDMLFVGANANYYSAIPLKDNSFMVSENRNDYTDFKGEAHNGYLLSDYEDGNAPYMRGFVNIESDYAVFSFKMSGMSRSYGEYCLPKLKIFIDGNLINSIERSYYYYDDSFPIQKHIPLTKGLHYIDFELYNDSIFYGENVLIHDVGVKSTMGDLIVINLQEPGLLGSELLEHVAQLSDVQFLKVIGKMNGDDLNVLANLNKVVKLDLSESEVVTDDALNIESAELIDFSFPKGLKTLGKLQGGLLTKIVVPESVTEISEGAFNGLQCLNEVKLPNNLQTIGSVAFYNCPSLLSVDFPEGLQTIGSTAFYGCTSLQHVDFPEGLQTIGPKAFYGCTSLQHVDFPEGLQTIDFEAFCACISLQHVDFPEGLQTIGSEAFYACTSLQHVNFSEGLQTIGSEAFYACFSLQHVNFSEGLQTIGSSAFEGAPIDTLIFPESLESINSQAFTSKYARYIELPTRSGEVASNSFRGRFYDDGEWYNSFHSDSLTIKIKSPFVQQAVLSNNTNITVLVPDFLVSAYKLSSWKDFKNIKGFSTDEVKDWYINSPLVLDAKSRLKGAPNIHLETTSLTLKGDTPMEVDDLKMHFTNDRDYYLSLKYSQILSSADIDVVGQAKIIDYYTSANTWNFLSLPFDIRVGDIETSAAHYAIRYYDGANRAETAQASGNWKEYAADDVITAGTGFIYITSNYATTTFTALDNDNKDRAFKGTDLQTALQANPSEATAHRGWNLVGNPWLTYYNIRSLGTTAPITTYSPSYGGGTYRAYSIVDDEVALAPMQAFFVQCPDGEESIGFPTDGRQLTADVATAVQSTRPVMRSAAQGRQLIDLQIVDGNEADDPTRIVLNEDATLGYDYGSDASKFFAEGSALQLYTLNHEGETYAINERPVDDGMVNLGFIAPADGSYTIRLKRNQAAEVYLTDRSTGKTVDLTKQDYIFTCKAGEHTNRMVLALKADPTGIAGTLNAEGVAVVEGGLQTTVAVKVYGMDGRQLAEGTGYVALPKGMYVVKTGEQATKVVVK